MLKHLPEKLLNKIKKTLLYSNKPVYYNRATIERRRFNSTMVADITNLNNEQRMSDFQDMFKSEHLYRVPLCYFCDIDFKTKCHLETDMKKLFESNKKVTATGTPDAKVIFTKAHFLQYKQFLLDAKFRQYFETITVSKKILRMGGQKTPIQKTYEISTGSDSINTDFLGSNRPFVLSEIYLVYDKSDKHTLIDDSYNVELAAKYIKSIKLIHFTEIYCLTNQKKCSIDNLTQKHLLYKQFDAWSCDGCSRAHLTDYIYNSAYQELIEKADCFGIKSDERIYLNLTASGGCTNEMEKLERNDSKTTLYITLKSAATKKLRLRIWGYSLGEYLYILARDV